MIVIKCLLFYLCMIGIPLSIGAIPLSLISEKRKSPVLTWLYGLMISWAVFQVICVPGIFLNINKAYDRILLVYSGAMGVLAAAGIFLTVRKGIKDKAPKEAAAKADAGVKNPAVENKGLLREYLWWMIFLGLVAAQLLLAVLMTYGDGDDAFYVAASTVNGSSKTLYKILPYTGGTTGMDMRHGLAPLPVWIAMLGNLFKLPIVSVNHVLLPPIFIAATYGIFYELGKRLFKGDRQDKLPVFLSFTALLVLFGDYSLYTVENFMIARSRQGKAALGSMIIPMVILLVYQLMEHVENKERFGRDGLVLWLMLTATVTAACLCTTMGTFLMCLFLAILGLCMGAAYRKLGLVVKTALCCIPAVIFAILYFVV